MQGCDRRGSCMCWSEVRWPCLRLKPCMHALKFDGRRGGGSEVRCTCMHACGCVSCGVMFCTPLHWGLCLRLCLGRMEGRQQEAHVVHSCALETC